MHVIYARKRRPCGCGRESVDGLHGVGSVCGSRHEPTDDPEGGSTALGSIQRAGGGGGGKSGDPSEGEISFIDAEAKENAERPRLGAPKGHAFSRTYPRDQIHTMLL